jgi:hypothetical protein
MKKITLALALIALLAFTGCVTTGGTPAGWDQLTTLAKGMKITESFTWSFVPSEVKATIVWESWNVQVTPPALNARGSFDLPIEQLKGATGEQVMALIIQHMNLCIGGNSTGCTIIKAIPATKPVTP